eukprot:CAMPEP_0202688864 /NCGR_PEP_ID=MMETSP1385-20130828/4265_1 /ASSEMBLY_ACC=CAM_ASM_000861 /TAXON_ID=933848 /ORGANISM="Elphidium margaritaceum" /LENGTH=103 /DNA_ID=CAMNT_0049343915 /DNA_START=42 /DNA_END=353 /DNA_ORIENTATION=-
MYIRFKRHKTTVFLTCDENEDLELVKQRLADAVNHPIATIQLRNINNELLDEEKTMNELGLNDDHEICFVYKIENTADDWEPIEIEKPNSSSTSNSQSKHSKK